MVESKSVYTFVGKIGKEGPIGAEVYLAINEESQEQIAIKTIDIKLIKESVRHQIIKSKAMRSLEHPLVTKYYECFYHKMDDWEDERLCIPMEFCEGESLR